MPPQQAAIASQQEATALMTISGEAAKAAVPEARSRRPAIVKVLFMVKSVSLIWEKSSWIDPRNSSGWRVFCFNHERPE